MTDKRIKMKIEIPCSVGDKIVGFTDYGEKPIETTIQYFQIDKRGIKVYTDYFIPFYITENTFGEIANEIDKHKFYLCSKAEVETRLKEQ